MIRRGDVFLVKKGKGDNRDPKRQRLFVFVSWQPLIDYNFPTAAYAQITSKLSRDLPTQVLVDENDGMKMPCAILCDALFSLEKTVLTDYKGRLSDQKVHELNLALSVALGLV